MISPTADSAPIDNELTDYDREHLVVYLRLLDAAEDGADWRQVARIVLGLDPDQDPERVRKSHESHLARARWLRVQGYRELLREG